MGSLLDVTKEDGVPNVRKDWLVQEGLVENYYCNG